MQRQGGSERADLLQGDPSVVADDDVIEQVDAQKLARLVEPLRHPLVLDAGSGIAAGMVVRHDDRCAGGQYRIFVFSLILWVHSLRVKGAD